MESKNLGKNSLLSIIKSCCSVIFPLITFPYVTRVLQPENVGKINFSNSIVSYFSLLASLGITTYAIRECAKVKYDKAKLGKISSEIWSINIVTTIFSYALLGLLLFSPVFKEYKMLILIHSSSIFFTTIGADWINNAMEDFKYIAIRTVFFQILSLLLVFIFIHEANDYIKYAIITVVSLSGANLMNCIYRKRYCITKFVFKMNIRKHFIPIIELFAMLVAQHIFTTCDTTVIGFVLGDFEVGIYTTALRIYNVITTLIASITWVVLPQLTVAFSQKCYDEINRILQYALNFIFILGMPCVIGLFFLNEEIVFLVGGSSYWKAASVLRILSITLLTTFFSNFLLNIYMLSAGKDKVCLRACLIAAGFNCLTNMLFIPIWGINAAAFTTMVSQIILSLFCIPHLDKNVNVIKLFGFIWQPLFGAFGVLVIIQFFKWITDLYWLRIGGAVLVGGMIYFVILYITKNSFVMGISNKIFRIRGDI